MIKLGLQFPKYLPIQIFFAVLFSLQIVACSSKDVAQTITDELPTESAESTESSENTDPSNPDPSIYTDVNLTWTAPAERENNVPIALSEIAGYKVYYGTEERSYSNSININDGSTTGYTFSNLAAGTYHFALTTYDTAGRESQYSSEIVIVV